MVISKLMIIIICSSLSEKIDLNAGKYDEFGL